MQPSNGSDRPLAGGRCDRNLTGGLYERCVNFASGFNREFHAASAIWSESIFTKDCDMSLPQNEHALKYLDALLKRRDDRGLIKPIPLIDSVAAGARWAKALG